MDTDHLDEDRMSIDVDAEYTPYTKTSPTDTEFSDNESDTVSSQEVHNLRMGLSQWELHDLERLGYSQETLRRQFPEMVSVHSRFDRELPAAPRKFKDCSCCHKERIPEVEEAISEGLVVLCPSCGSPEVRHEQTHESCSLLSMQSCLCYCSCPQEQLEVSPDPMWMPFLTRLIGTTVSPVILRTLQDLGFCIRDTEGELLRDAIAGGSDRPTYRQIVTNTIPDYLLLTPAERLGDVWETLRDATRFPNGVCRDLETDSGLPSALETTLRQIDPNAFGHVTRERYDRVPDLSRGHELSQGERLRWDRIHFLRIRREDLDGTSQEGSAWLALWVAEYEYDFGLEDDDLDSVCSIDEMGEEAWEEMQQEERASCDFQDCQHRLRHQMRKIDRIATRGGYPVIEDEVAAAAWLHLEFEDDLAQGGSIFDIDDSGVPPVIESDDESEFARYDTWNFDPTADTDMSENSDIPEAPSPIFAALYPNFNSLAGSDDVSNDLTNFRDAMADYINSPAQATLLNEVNGGQTSAFSDDSDDDSDDEEFRPPSTPRQLPPIIQHQAITDFINAMAALDYPDRQAGGTNQVNPRQNAALDTLLRTHGITERETAEHQVSWNRSGQGQQPDEPGQRRRST